MTALLTIGLVLLVWIALALQRLVSLVSELKRTNTYPDSAHPAFSRAHIHDEHKLLDEYGARAEQIQRDLNQNPEFVELCKTGRVPSPALESTMQDACMETAFWYGHLRNLHFMIEANLMVRRGELTISEARQVYSDINCLFGWKQGSESHAMLQEWKARLTSKVGRDEAQEHAETKPTELEPRLDRLRKLQMEWESRFERCKPGPPRPR
jgi:hypothetical protein